MIQRLLKVLTLRFFQRFPYWYHGNFWNQYFCLGSFDHSIGRSRICDDLHQPRRHRIGTRYKFRRGQVQRALPLILFLFSFSSLGQVTQSVTKGSRPLWEGGLALVSARVPAYPGANQYNFFTLPFPSFFYRGHLLRADEEGGMRGRFFKNDTFEINLSVGGSLPANSDKNDARQGMPDLKTMGELGPGLLATLWQQSGKQSYKLGVNIPLRAAVAMDFWSLKERGLVFNPLLYFITENTIANKVFTFTGISSVVASQKFHRVFYQVDPQYVTPSRPAYQASSGYLSTTISQGFSTQIYKNVMTFFGVSYAHYKGSANYNSPLMKQDYNFNMALGLVWWFYESDAKENSNIIKKQLSENRLF